MPITEYKDISRHFSLSWDGFEQGKTTNQPPLPALLFVVRIYMQPMMLQDDSQFAFTFMNEHSSSNHSSIEQSEQIETRFLLFNHRQKSLTNLPFDRRETAETV
jgi:hypothetical protein